MIVKGTLIMHRQAGFCDIANNVENGIKLHTNSFKPSLYGCVCEIEYLLVTKAMALNG